jgi:HEAT repeat protein
MKFEFDDRDRESVLRDLVDEDEEVRRLAVERVSALPIDEAIPRLVERIGDSSWRVRKAAVERLVACSDTTQMVGALIVALGDGENTGRRNSAVEALVDCGSRAVPQLVAAMESPDSDVRKLVVDALAGIGDPRSAPALIELLGDPDANVRAAVSDALGAIDGEDSARALQKVATCEEEEQLVRFSALHAMAALEVPIRARELAPVLNDAVLRPAGLALLGRVDDDEEAVTVLLKSLASHSRSVREAAIGSLLRTLSGVDGARAEVLAARIREAAQASPLVIGSAVDRLTEANLPTRLLFLQFLGLVRAEEAVVPMLLAAEDEALSQIALANLESLGELAERAIEAAWSDLDANARTEACVLFGRTGGEASAARLIAALEDPSPELRNAAARSIGQRGLTGALPLLLHRLKSAAEDDDFESEDEIALLTEALIGLARPRSDSDPEITENAISLLTSSVDGAAEAVRLAIATVIGRIGRQHDAQVVEFLLKDPSPLVRRAAVDALARLDPGTAAESLRLALADEASIVRIAAAGALGASQSEGVIDILHCLADDEDPEVRAAALRSVGSRFIASPDEKHRSFVIELIDSALADEAVVALAAIETLKGMSGPIAERALQVLDRAEPELVREAVRCVGAHGDASCVESLLPLVSHPDWTVRAETIQVLADRGVAKSVPPILRRLEMEQDNFVRDTIMRALDRFEG